MEIKIDMGETVVRREKAHIGHHILVLFDLAMLLLGILLLLVSPILAAFPLIYAVYSIGDFIRALGFLFIAKKTEIICTDRKLIVKSAAGTPLYINLEDIASVEPEDDYFIFKFFNLSKKFHYGQIALTMKEVDKKGNPKMMTIAPYVKNHTDWCKDISEQIEKLG